MKVKSITNHKSLRAKKVSFSEKERTILESFSVKTATNAALTAWKSINKDSRTFAAKLERVRRVMVKGNSPKSLFSKWLKAHGIPRATAYWYLTGSGGHKSATTPLIQRLLKERDTLTKQLAKMEAKLKAESDRKKKVNLRDEKKELEQKIATKDGQVVRQRESLERQIKDAFKDVKTKIQKVSWFTGHADDQEPLAKLIVEQVKALNLTWQQSGDMLVKALSAIQKGNDPVAAVFGQKKPSGSVRPSAHVAAQA